MVIFLCGEVCAFVVNPELYVFVGVCFEWDGRGCLECKSKSLCASRFVF